MSVATPSETPRSLLQDNQVVVYYGSPLGLGILGQLDPIQAADAVIARAKTYDDLNGHMGALPALDLIYSVAMDEPTDNGLYLRFLPDQIVEGYMRVADERGLELFLDVQIGRAQVLDEVKRLEPFLRNPHVHVAIDPEYAVGPDGVPLATPGRIRADEINAVQQYLHDLVDANGLPGKMLVVHQYLDDTIVDGDRIATIAGVDYVLNMDALGDIAEKKRKYEFFSSKDQSRHDAFNIFFAEDERVLSEGEILGLRPAPRVVFYQ